MDRFPSLDDCLGRIAARESEIHAWVQVRPQPPTASGALDGLAFGAKDIFETAGLATEYGSPVYRGRQGTRDAALVALLRARGATLLGKTQTTAFASFDPAPTRNPLTPERTPGGSSAGSAAAVAAGMAAFALGTQTLGSILRPAAYCGVCGFKPTFGLLPVQGVLPFAPSLDTAGFFTATPARMLDLWQRFRGRPCPHPGTPAAIFEPPDGWSDLIQAAYTVNRFEGARSHAARYSEFGDRIGFRLSELIRQGLATPKSEYRAAIAQIDRMRGVLARSFSRARFLLSPAAEQPAPIGYHSTGDPSPNAPWTALGVPAICVPIPGENPPRGLQITAAWGDDDALVAFAAGPEAEIRAI